MRELPNQHAEAVHTTDAAEISRLAEECAATLERGGINEIPGGVSSLITLLRSAAGALAEAELSAMMLEAKDETIAMQAELVASIGYPILEVHRGVFCAPAVGPLDLERATMLGEALLAAVTARLARHVIVDITGAFIEDAAVVGSLVSVARTLRLVGVPVSLSGIRPNIALLLAPRAHELAGIPTYRTLADALTALNAGRTSHTAPQSRSER